MAALAIRGVGYLIVILNKGDKGGRFDVQAWRASTLLLPLVTLALIKVAILHGRNEFLGCPQIVGVISFSAAAERNHRGVMEIVVPQTIQAIAALLGGLHQLYLLRFVFGYKNHFAWCGTLAGFPSHGGDDVMLGAVMDVLGGIPPAAIQVEFLDPVAGIGDAEFADRS